MGVCGESGLFGNSPRNKQTRDASCNYNEPSPAMVNGDASSSSREGSKRKAVNPTAVAGKKRKITAQTGSPEWPSYLHDVRQLPASDKLTYH